MLDLVYAAKNIGFDAFGASGEYEDLMKENMPCIAHTVTNEGLQHFIVIFAIDLNGVIICDPGKGIYKLSKSDFLKIWIKKAVVLLTPNEKLLNEKSPTWSKWIYLYLKKEEIWFYQAIFLGIIYTLLGLLTSLFIQKIIDIYIPDQNSEKVILTGLFLFVLLIIRSFSGYFRGKFLVLLNKRISLNINKDFLEHLFNLPKKFFDTRKTGDITARINDATRIQSAILQITSITIIDLLVIVSSIVFIFNFSTTLAYLTLFTIPIYGIVLFYNTRKIKNQQNDVMKSFSLVESNYINSIKGIDEIISFNSASFFSKFNRQFYELFQNNNERLGYTQNKITLFAELLSTIILIGLLTYGSFLVLREKILLGQLMASYSLIASIIPSVNRLVSANISLQGASVAVTRLMDLLLVQKEDFIGEESIQTIHTISIKNGSFSWNGRNNLFTDISINVEKGLITSLWGPSGSGKSTLVNIIQKKYSLTSGKLLINDIDAGIFNLFDYREKIGVVPQEIKIFNGTLADNILVGRRINNIDKFQNKIKELGFDSFVNRFENGIYTIIGEEGRNLSGGEAQLLALLRALFNDPDVLIIDEGLSGIDVELSEMVNKIIQNFSKNNAVLLITHNLEIVLQTDYLYVLENKKIIENGTVASLLESESYINQMLNRYSPSYLQKILVSNE